jgi:hypothetical protein
MFVDVELRGELRRGQTIADRRLTVIALHNADVSRDIDRSRFEANFLAAIKGGPGASAMSAICAWTFGFERPLRNTASACREAKSLPFSDVPA